MRFIKGGLKIYTTLDLDMQAAAAESLKISAWLLQRRLSAYTAQVALVAVKTPTNGYIKAMIGGRGQDKFNRAVLAVRQPGSRFQTTSFYLTAMDNGLTAATVVEDKEYEFAPGWKPKNSDLQWHGKVSLRTALKKSYNIPTILVAQQVGPEKGFPNG